MARRMESSLSSIQRIRQQTSLPVRFLFLILVFATETFLRFGRGQHKARLNFGDCLTYAVARLANEPLLFVGEDFTQTDLALA